ncbi:MAG: glycosyltransferase [Isosphaeraceae bacterium]|jgi:glycosyltransferase involved in cell wall biosynthesis
MDDPCFLSSASFWTPCDLTPSARWLGHVPFAFWLVDAAGPRGIVELGAGRGDAYFAFCQAVQRLDTGTRCFAVDTWGSGDPDGLDGDAAFRHISEVNALHFTMFSSLIRTSCDRAADRFEDGSIDLLHISGPHSYEAAWRVFDAWSPKMSSRGVVLFDGTDDSEGDQGLARLFRELAGRYPSFEFLHDGGLGVVGVGEQLPGKVDDLLKSSQSASQRDEVRRCYARLGQGLIDHRERRTLAGPNGGPATLGSVPADRPDSETAILAERISSLSHELDRIQQSLGWALVQKARKIRTILFREGGLSGRCWRAFSRFVKVAMTEGIGTAVAKARARIKQKMGRRVDVTRPLGERTGGGLSVGTFVSFQQLPWRCDGESVTQPADGARSYKVLLVLHEASRTGAPLCMLRLAEQLAQNGDLDCWIVLDRGGELVDEFARVAPTVSVDLLSHQGIAREQAPDLIAALFREYADSGVAICNTACVGGYYAACAAHHVPVLAWVHEMPTSIDWFCGGRNTVDLILRSARRIITPANTVRDALTTYYQLEDDRVQTFYNGLCVRDDHRPRSQERQRVREELGLPEDAQLVLGCGTIELRKGVDMFVQMARIVLADESTSKLWFLWLGKTLDTCLKCWLEHDLAKEGLHDRVRFLGPREDPRPYFKAADVFALTSREDPCPLVNMEAMASGLPVVAFKGAGGAPELLEDCGLVVPYADLEATAQAVLHLLASPEKCESLGRRAKEKIYSNFTWPRSAERLIRILEEDYHYRPTSGRTFSIDAQHLNRRHHLDMHSRARR